MILFEREADIRELQNHFKNLRNGIGHTVLVTGEAGMGKTALIKSFASLISEPYKVLIGSCDPLFTPRPLGPLFDIGDELGGAFMNLLQEGIQRTQVFSGILKILQNSIHPVLFVIEDIHWADETTIDFIKFLSRRIPDSNCLLILTYRQNEVERKSILKYALSDIPVSNHSKIQLNYLSEEAVYQMVADSKLSPRHIYKISKGHPFFVSEIVSNAEENIPSTIKEVVLSRVNKLSNAEKEILEFASLFPKKIEISLFIKLKPNAINEVENILKTGILVEEGNSIKFKHEIARLAITDSISVLKRTYLHGLIVNELQKNPENSDLSMMVHHAKNAHKTSIVVSLAPKAADNASKWGAHTEAARLYKVAIDFSEEINDEEWIRLLEKYSIECYLTNQLNEAITTRIKIEKLLERSNNNVKIGDNYRWLSRMNWYHAKNEKAFRYAALSIEYLEKSKTPSRELSQSYSNYGQLFMLKNDLKNTIYWCDKAISLATQFNHEAILAHAYTNVGSIKMNRLKTENEGEIITDKALKLAVKVNNQDHIIRIYTSKLCKYILNREFEKLQIVLPKAIDFCTANEIDSYLFYIRSWQALYTMLIGEWKISLELSNRVLKIENQANINTLMALIPKAKIKMRMGEKIEAEALLIKAGQIALPTKETQRILPVACGMLEHQWLYQHEFKDQSVIQFYKQLTNDYSSQWLVSELAFWLKMNGISIDNSWEILPFYRELIDGFPTNAANRMFLSNCQYEAAVMLSLGDETDQRRAIKIADDLGAVATVQKFREIMKNKGIKNVPKGARKSTKSNPAMLTNRQMDVLIELGNGLQNSEIAAKLFISNKTVDHHVSAIFIKLDTTSRSKAVIRAKELGIL